MVNWNLRNVTKEWENTVFSFARGWEIERSSGKNFELCFVPFFRRYPCLTDYFFQEAHTDIPA